MWMKELTVGLLGTCCYLLGAENGQECVVIDPGAEPPRIRQAAEGRRIAAILLTHGHFDHIGGVSALMNPAAGEPAPVLYIHPLDRDMLTDPVRNAGQGLLGREVLAPFPAEPVAEGQELSLAGLSIRVLHTPGHTPGSVCYLVGEDLFSGDTMFAYGWGRTDLPGGSEEAMMNSLRRLMPMARKMRLHPGHGE